MHTQTSTQTGAHEQTKIDKFLHDNKNIVNKILSQINTKRFDREVLYQEGLMGLWKAFKRYSPDKKTKLSTYAYVCARNSIFNEIRKQSSRAGRIETISITHEDIDIDHKDWNIDFLELFNEQEQKIVIDHYIYRLPARELCEDLDLSISKFRKILRSIEYKIIQEEQT